MKATVFEFSTLLQGRKAPGNQARANEPNHQQEWPGETVPVAPLLFVDKNLVAAAVGVTTGKDRDMMMIGSSAPATR